MLPTIMILNESEREDMLVVATSTSYKYTHAQTYTQYTVCSGTGLICQSYLEGVWMKCSVKYVHVILQKRQDYLITQAANRCPLSQALCRTVPPAFHTSQLHIWRIFPSTVLTQLRGSLTAAWRAHRAATQRSVRTRLLFIQLSNEPEIQFHSSWATRSTWTTDLRTTEGALQLKGAIRIYET